MIFFSSENLVVRNMKESDSSIIHNENQSHGWNSDLDTYQKYFYDQQTGNRSVFVAEYNSVFAGYVTLRCQATAGPFANMNIPEISDLNVFEKYRKKGIGSKLLDCAEDVAFSHSNTVCLGVGLHSGYGSAQRLYVKRGYIFDGSGVWYQNRPLSPYNICRNDDDLVLYLSKQLC